MLLLALALAASPVAPAIDKPVINPDPGHPYKCPAISRYQATHRGDMPQGHKLNELPDADVYRAVYRHIGGCQIPVIVKYRVGDR